MTSLRTEFGGDLVERVCRAVDALEEELVELLAALVRIPTVNPPGSCYRDCADLIARRYKELGYETKLIPAEGMAEHTERAPRINLLGPLANAEPRLHFNGHFDVVPAGDDWSVDPFGAAISGRKLFGRGTADQKAGLAASLFAVEAIRRCGLRLAGTVEQSAT